MIVRSISGPHVCLRCQFRLARRPLPARKVRFQSTTTQATPNRPEEEESAGESKDEEVSNFTIRYPEVWRPYVPVKTKPRLNRSPLGHLYGFRGRKIRERQEDLGVVNLGKPSQVIVLKDEGVEFMMRPKLELLEPEPIEPVDILERLEREKGLVDHEEVMNNIDELRPKEQDKAVKSWKDVTHLMKVLSKGFTVSQLATYIDLHATERTFGAERPMVQLAPGLSIKVSSWLPGVSQSIDHFDRGLLRGYNAPKNIAPKQRLAFLLIRDCWALKIPEVEDGFGEIEVYIPIQDLERLIWGMSSPLSRISKDVLITGEKIETSRSREVIRITSTQKRAEILIREIERVVRSITHDIIDATPLLCNNQMEKLLQDPRMASSLANFTETEVEFDSNNFTVSYVNDQSIYPSTPGEVVKRMLLGTLEPRAKLSGKLRCLVDDNVGSGAFVPIGNKEGLAWYDRFHTWSRWQSAARKPNATGLENTETSKPSSNSKLIVFDDHKATGSSKASEHVVRNEDDMVKLVAIKRGAYDQIGKEDITTPIELADGAYWERSMYTQSSSIPGVIVHRGPDVDSPIPSNIKTAIAKTTDRTFLPLVPSISRMLGSRARLDDRNHKNIYMYFRPSVWPSSVPGHAAGKEVLDVFPTIEMRFSLNHSNRAMELEHVVARGKTEISDVILPHQVVDLRFIQEMTCRMGNSHRLPAIKEFITSSKVIAGLPNTPPGLVLPIPKHMISKPGHELVNKDGELTNVEYLFVEHEMRSTILLDYRGWVLVFTSIRGGEMGGRRIELRLRPKRSPRWTGPADPRYPEHEQFMKASFKLAEEFGDGSLQKRIERVAQNPNLKPTPIRFTASTPPVKEEMSVFRAKRVRLSHDDEEVNSENPERIQDQKPESSERMQSEESPENLKEPDYFSGDGDLAAADSADSFQSRKPSVVDSSEIHGVQSKLLDSLFQAPVDESAVNDQEVKAETKSTSEDSFTSEDEKK